MVSGLSAGDYNVTIQTFNPYCYNRVTVTVSGGGGGGNPCAGQGGDSDGDGICDNQDNCDFNPNSDLTHRMVEVEAEVVQIVNQQL